MKTLQFAHFSSPIGTILLVLDGDTLCALDFSDYETRMHTLLQRRFVQFTLAPTNETYGITDRLDHYFSGDHHALDTIPVSLGGTPFQQQVWLALRSIPPGSTFTYGQLATHLGKPTAYRAVGSTNALNPIGIVLPCHRVIGSDKSLTGYAGGLARKQWLLQHEGFLPPHLA